MTTRLARYVELERLSLALEREDEAAADTIRDKMDPLWYELSEDERRFLDLRSTGVFEQLEWVRLPARAVVSTPSVVMRSAPLPKGPIRDWKAA